MEPIVDFSLDVLIPGSMSLLRPAPARRTLVSGSVSLACQKGLSVGFNTAAALVHELLEARDEKRLLRLQRQLAGYKLLIIDELGYVPLAQTGAELLFEVFSQRYERGSTVVTSNLPFDEWTSVFGSERLTGALLDTATATKALSPVPGVTALGSACELNFCRERSAGNPHATICVATTSGYRSLVRWHRPASSRPIPRTLIRIAPRLSSPTSRLAACSQQRVDRSLASLPLPLCRAQRLTSASIPLQLAKA